MKENSPLQEMCPDKRLSNHSVRKTVVRKLKAKGVPKSEIITITGHRQERSVEIYDSGNEDEQRKLSNMIDGKEIQFKQTTSRVPPQPLIQSSAVVSSGHVYNFHNCNVVINQGQATFLLIIISALIQTIECSLHSFRKNLFSYWLFIDAFDCLALV